MQEILFEMHFAIHSRVVIYGVSEIIIKIVFAGTLLVHECILALRCLAGSLLTST